MTQRKSVLCIRNCAENSCWGKLIAARLHFEKRITVLFSDHMECEYYHNNWIITIGMSSPWNDSPILNTFIVMVSITKCVQNSFKLILGGHLRFLLRFGAFRKPPYRSLIFDYDSNHACRESYFWIAVLDLIFEWHFQSCFSRFVCDFFYF